LVDYKTGGPLSKAIKPTTRREHLVQRVASGGALQPVVYALAPEQEPATGRYLFLRPEIGDAVEDARDVRIRDDETDIVEAFTGAVATVATAWASGVCLPRVVDPGKNETPRHCEWCDVSEACLRDDTDYTRRIVQWIDRSDGEEKRGRTAAALWGLRSRSSENGE
jgi:hypothetical protein